MNNKQKIIIFISFLSISGISYFSWRTIAKKDNRQPIIHQEKKDEDSPKIIPDDHQKNKSSLWWIIIVIVLLLATTIIIYAFIKKNGNSTKTNNLPDGTETKPNKIPDILKTKDNNVKDPTSSPIIPSKIEPPKGEIQYDNWVCGINIEDNKIQLVFSQNWNKDDLANKIYDLDVKNKSEDKNIHDRLKILYKNATENQNQFRIYGFIHASLDLLQYIDAPFLRKIQANKNLLEAEKKEDNTCYYDNLLQLASTFDQESKKKKLNEPIILKKSAAIKKYESVTEGIYSFDFNTNNSWPLFRTIVTRKFPVAYYDKKNENDTQKTAEPLFAYSYQLFDLISAIKEEFIELLTSHQELIETAKVETLNKCLSKIKEVLNS